MTYRPEYNPLYDPKDPSYIHRGSDQASANIRAAQEQTDRGYAQQTNWRRPTQPSGQYSMQYVDTSPQPWQRNNMAQSQSGQQHTYYAGEGTQSYLDAGHFVGDVVVGAAAYQAGRNYYNIHPDTTAATIHGADALRRWQIWRALSKVWVVEVLILVMFFFEERAMTSLDPVNDLAERVRNGAILLLPTLVFGVLIPYCRNVDFSLFKRRLLYRILRPLLVVTNWIPTWALYLTIFSLLVNWS